MAEIRIAVVGAGVAGMSCAAELARTDARVTVFERSRGLGGRLATRRERGATFDHGAQFVTARSRPFSKFMEGAARAGVAAPWRPRLSEDTRIWDAPIEDWYVGVPGMSALVRPLGRYVQLLSGTSVHELFSREGGWELVTDAGRHKQLFDAIAVAIPAPQALTLLAPYSRAFRHLTDVVFAPCWSAMLAFTIRCPCRPRRCGGPADRSPGRPVTRAARGARRRRTRGYCTRRQSGAAHTSSSTRAMPRSRSMKRSPRRSTSRYQCRSSSWPIAGATHRSSRHSVCRAWSTRNREPVPAATGASHRASRPPSRAAAPGSLAAVDRRTAGAAARR